MNYRIDYDKLCVKYFKKLDKKNQLRIIKAINDLPDGDVKKLTNIDGNYRLRVGGYRIIFTFNQANRVICVLKISPRGDAY